jgi:thioesterase domain-containing protein
MTPAAFITLDALPLTPNGKINHKALPTPGQADDDAFIPPQTPVQAVLCRIWQEVLGRERVGIHDNFFALGGHSLLVLNLAARIQEAFGGGLPLADLYQNPTPAEMAKRLSETSKDDLPPSIVPLRVAGDHPPLYCVHPKNGTIFCFTAMARSLVTDHPIYGVQAHSINLDTKPHDSVEDMAAAYVQDITRVQPQGPYHLCGFSLGGMVAYEMARQLSAQGHEVARLVLLDAVPWLGDDDSDPTLEQLDEMDDVAFLVYQFGEAIPVTEDDLRPLPPDERIRHVLRLADAAGFATEHMDLRTMTRYVDIVRAHTRAALTYRGRPYSGTALLLRCGDPDDPAAVGTDPSLGWRGLVGDGLTVQYVEGGHMTMLDPPHLASLTKHMGNYLADATAHGRSSR